MLSGDHGLNNLSVNEFNNMNVIIIFKDIRNGLRHVGFSIINR